MSSRKTDPRQQLRTRQVDLPLIDALRRGHADGSAGVRIRQLRAGMHLVWEGARGPFSAALAVQSAAGLLLALQVVVVGSLITQLVDAPPGEALAGRAVALVALLVLLVVIGVLLALQTGLVALTGERVAAHTTDSVLGTAVGVEPELYEEPTYHDVLQRAAYSALNRNRQIATSLIGLLSGSISVIALLVAVGSIDLVLIPLVVAIGVPPALANARNGRDARTFIHETTELDRRRTYHWNAITRREVAKEVSAYQLGPWLRSRHAALVSARLGLFRSMIMRRTVRSAAAALLSGLLLAAAIVYLLVRYDQEALDAGAVGAGMLGMVALSQRMRTVLSSAGGLHEASLFIEDLEAFQALGELQPAGGEEYPEVHRIRLTDVGYQYPGADEPTLEGIDLEAKRGEVVALVGVNGSGKTTLAKLIGAVHAASSGTISYDEGVLTSERLAPARARVAFVFQDFEKWAFSGRDNIALGRIDRQIDDELIEQAARQARIHDELAGLPGGYDTTLSRLFADGRDLSHGQWQRVATARSIYRQADVLIFDEPTAALDPIAEREVFELIRRRLGDKIVVLISHRLASIRDADRIYVLDGGRLVQVGSHDDLHPADGVYRSLYDAQASLFGDSRG